MSPARFHAFKNNFLNYPPCIIKPCESYQWNIPQKHPEPYANSRQESISNTDWTYQTLTSQKISSSKIPQSFWLILDFSPFQNPNSRRWLTFIREFEPGYVVLAPLCIGSSLRHAECPQQQYNPPQVVHVLPCLRAVPWPLVNTVFQQSSPPERHLRMEQVCLCVE